MSDGAYGQLVKDPEFAQQVAANKELYTRVFCGHSPEVAQALAQRAYAESVQRAQHQQAAIAAGQYGNGLLGNSSLLSNMYVGQQTSRLPINPFTATEKPPVNPFAPRSSRIPPPPDGEAFMREMREKFYPEKPKTPTKEYMLRPY